MISIIPAILMLCLTLEHCFPTTLHTGNVSCCLTKMAWTEEIFENIQWVPVCPCGKKRFVQDKSGHIWLRLWNLVSQRYPRVRQRIFPIMKKRQISPLVKTSAAGFPTVLKPTVYLLNFMATCKTLD